MWIPDAGSDSLAQTPFVPRVAAVPRVSTALTQQTREGQWIADVTWGSEKTSKTPKKQTSKIYEKPLTALDSMERRVCQ